MKIQIWNPAKDEEYVLRDHITKRAFSSVTSNAFVVEVVGDLPWIVKCRNLEELIGKTTNGGRGFFSVNPWDAGATALRHKIKASISGTFENQTDIYGYLESPGQIGELMELRDEAGGFDSGEWRIGSCYGDFDNFENTRTRKDLSYFLDNVENVGFLLELFEMQQALLIVKSYDDARSDIDRLLYGQQ